MPAVSEQRLFDALATISRACGEGGVAAASDSDLAGLAALDEATRDVLGEAALAVAYGAFAARGGTDGIMHSLVAALGLMAVAAGEEPDPPAEILGVGAEDARVEAELDRAGEALDREFGRDADGAAMTAALEARILGNAILLGGCTLAEGDVGPAAVRLRAARALVRLAAGLVAMNATGDAAAGAPTRPAED
ncbi:hypothetical protein [Falsiroseomonas oryziterrae]|uniref:hypothetical protein n=1 Tax=Falsiroseomonas oryziterrae TaxID=2911368 RepID=UPI001F34BD63|nr:hypothetical protein [Roseomonas sp. NPKOSM-4]